MLKAPYHIPVNGKPIRQLETENWTFEILNYINIYIDLDRYK